MAYWTQWTKLQEKIKQTLCRERLKNIPTEDLGFQEGRSTDPLP